jgi:cob(I)alamin adenosyltransferase
MIIVNTGNGKGKTTAAIGQIIRSLGCGWRVCLIQLFKSKEFYAEQHILKKLNGLDFFSFAPRHPFCFPKTSCETVRKQCAQALKKFSRIIKQKEKYQLIVLEEFAVALRDGYLNLDELMKILSQADKDVTIIITGRGAPRALISRADLVTEMKEIKHPFKKGICAKKGIEF